MDRYDYGTSISDISQTDLSSNMTRAPRPTEDSLAREVSFANAMARIGKIVAPGVVGFHTHFEIIEIFEFSNVTRKATNVCIAIHRACILRARRCRAGGQAPITTL